MHVEAFPQACAHCPTRGLQADAYNYGRGSLVDLCVGAHAGLRDEDAGRAHYYPGAQPMRIKIVAERGTGRPLGAQIVGGDGAGKRIDVLATALWNEMTVEAVGGMDLSYAPPFSPVWDPVLLAACKAATKI